MVDADETVLTTRRALLRRQGAPWVPGRLRLTDRRLAFTGADEAVLLELDLEIVRAVRLRRGPARALVVVGPGAPVRLRCFNTRAIAHLLRDTVAAGR